MAGSDELRRDALERNFHPAAQGRIGLAGIRSDIDVDEALAGRTLYKWAA